MRIGKYYSRKKQEYSYSEQLDQCIKDTCQYCMDNTFGADDEKQLQPIMMLGKIQSGKTRAFTGLIALAFDNDFDMVFILTKNSKALVQQTESRMKKEFKEFVSDNEIEVKNIIKMCYSLTGYQLEKKLIIVAKKEKNNLDKLIAFIEKYSITQNKRTIIIDDEADTTGIGYGKIKDTDEYDLRTVAAKVNDMRGSLDGCVFVQVTATPYALYLQPEFQEGDKPLPVKPSKTVLVPSGDGYIGGEYYFMDSKKDDHPARFLFEAIDPNEHEIISDQKRKGKTAKTADRRTLKIEELLKKEKLLPTFKSGIMNFMVGTIVLRQDSNKHFAYAIHTGTSKTLHTTLKDIVDSFLLQIKERDEQTTPIIEKMLQAAYKDIECSVVAYGYTMPTYEVVSEDFYKAIDREYYRVDIVNSENEVSDLLDEESGELMLANPFSIFVGGQVLDRGVTISNLIGFYYGRSPNTMQQDTVMQHSRMFGYRKPELLSVTRFYTTPRIHSNMEKITEIDMELRAEIEKGNLGEGVYFITQKKQDAAFGKGGRIVPCSPDKIRVSDVILLKPHRRILPIGFSPVPKATGLSIDRQINKILADYRISENADGAMLPFEQLENVLHLIYKGIAADEEDSRFVQEDEFIVTLRYFLQDNKEVPVIVRKNRTLSKYRQSGGVTVLSDAPDTPQPLGDARKLANTLPVVMLIQEKGESEDWGNRPFWWPVLVSPAKIGKTLYATKTPGEKIRKADEED